MVDNRLHQQFRNATTTMLWNDENISQISNRSKV